VVTVVSRYTRGRFAAAFGPDTALELLHPGVDAATFRPDPHARATLRRRYGLGDAPVVTCVSRLVARKGQDQLLRVLPQLRARVPGTRLLLVGDGPDARRLRGLADVQGVTEHVVFTGPVPAAELPTHHAVGDAFALPCRTRGGGLDVEGLGIVLLEASASGLPVVAGDSGGAPETVREGVTGHVVGGRDTGALTEALAGLLADPDRARQMGAAGREWMLREWALPALVQRLRQLLAGGSPCPGPARPGHAGWLTPE
jgi:phosphatidylinositol alpha-1,6-mannosyltransferase